MSGDAFGLLEWDPLATPAPTESVRWGAGRLRVGDRVRLQPRARADIMDIALRGRIAVVEAIERDYDDTIHIAVLVEDDPGIDLGVLRQPGHRFFFSLDDLEPVAAAEPGR